MSRSSSPSFPTLRFLTCCIHPVPLFDHIPSSSSWTSEDSSPVGIHPVTVLTSHYLSNVSIPCFSFAVVPFIYMFIVSLQPANMGSKWCASAQEVWQLPESWGNKLWRSPAGLGTKSGCTDEAQQKFTWPGALLVLIIQSLFHQVEREYIFKSEEAHWNTKRNRVNLSFSYFESLRILTWPSTQQYVSK